MEWPTIARLTFGLKRLEKYFACWKPRFLYELGDKAPCPDGKQDWFQPRSDIIYLLVVLLGCMRRSHMPQAIFAFFKEDIRTVGIFLHRRPRT